MAYIGQGIAFSALVAAAAYLETAGFETDGLWLVIVIWVLCTEWHPRQKD